MSHVNVSIPTADAASITAGAATTPSSSFFKPDEAAVLLTRIAIAAVWLTLSYLYLATNFVVPSDNCGPSGIDTCDVEATRCYAAVANACFGWVVIVGLASLCVMNGAIVAVAPFLHKLEPGDWIAIVGAKVINIAMSVFKFAWFAMAMIGFSWFLASAAFWLHHFPSCHLDGHFFKKLYKKSTGDTIKLLWVLGFEVIASMVVWLSYTI